jgi:hypothetical protein
MINNNHIMRRELISFDQERGTSTIDQGGGMEERPIGLAVLG